MATLPRLHPRDGTTPYPTRVVVASAMTVWLALQVAAVAVGAGRGGGPEGALEFWLTGLITLLLAAFTYRAWRWVKAGRRPTLIDTDEESPRHQGLAGEVKPPRRW